jgi:hypothetical protein
MVDNIGHRFVATTTLVCNMTNACFTHKLRQKAPLLAFLPLFLANLPLAWVRRTKRLVPANQNFSKNHPPFG